MFIGILGEEGKSRFGAAASDIRKPPCRSAASGKADAYWKKALLKVKL